MTTGERSQARIFTAIGFSLDPQKMLKCKVLKRL